VLPVTAEAVAAALSAPTEVFAMFAARSARQVECVSTLSAPHLRIPPHTKVCDVRSTTEAVCPVRLPKPAVLLGFER
jgi:hypothetical protein